MPIRVVKVGGSLFDLPDLAQRLRRWLARQTPAHHVLVAGGGALVEQIRQWHRRQPLDESAAHWMCIDVLTVTAHLLHDRLPEIPLVEDDRWLLGRVGDQGCTIFGPAPWLRHSEPRIRGTRLPASWEVTSDSIAARLAAALLAQELVLVKSRSPRKLTLEGLAAEGLIDGFMPRLAAELPAAAVVDLRSEGFQEFEVQTA
jgi:aspartokinase-like uncharacterized kinase